MKDAFDLRIVIKPNLMKIYPKKMDQFLFTHHKNVQTLAPI